MHADNATDRQSIRLYALYTCRTPVKRVQALVKQRHVIDRPSCLIQFQSGLRPRTTIRSSILHASGRKTD